MNLKSIKKETVIIIVLALIVVGFAYNKWGDGMLASIKYKLSGQEEKDKLQIGDANATLRVVEYYSYGCEYCKIFEDEVKPEIVKNYVSGGNVRWIFRPVDVGLGDAALCANDQGKFLEYHDALFRNAANIQEETDLKQLAKNVGMNEEEFWNCYSSGKYTTLVIGWYNDLMTDFKRYKIAEEQKGTPAFVIGDEMITGVQPYNVFAETIEKSLSK
jgi:protein-disulfide isomerase